MVETMPSAPAHAFGDVEVQEDRLAIVADFYCLPITLLSTIAAMEKESRKPLCRTHRISPSIVRTMVDYDRYGQASDIYRMLGRFGEHIEGLNILDFGCLVADYALYFSRLGAAAAVYDLDEEVLRFVRHRFDAEGRSFRQFAIPTGYPALMEEMDVVIFGEVLEHIKDPRLPIAACIRSGVRYNFTSSYPIGDDEYFALSGHLRSAQILQPDCIRLLSGSYDAYPLSDKSVLWKERE